LEVGKAARLHDSQVVFISGNHEFFTFMASQNSTQHLDFEAEYNTLFSLGVCLTDNETVKKQKIYDHARVTAAMLTLVFKEVNPQCEMKIIHQVQNAVYCHGGLTKEMFLTFRIFSNNYLKRQSNSRFQNMNFYETCNYIYNSCLLRDEPITEEMLQFYHDVVLEVCSDRSLNRPDEARDTELFNLINAHNSRYELPEVTTIVVGHTIQTPGPRILRSGKYQVMLGDSAMSTAFLNQENPSRFDRGRWLHTHAAVGCIDYTKDPPDASFLAFRPAEQQQASSAQSQN
jgi:hypothetical protein